MVTAVAKTVDSDDRPRLKLKKSLRVAAKLQRAREQPSLLPVRRGNMTPHEMNEAAGLMLRYAPFTDEELLQTVMPYANRVGLGGLLRRDWKVRIPVPSLLSEFVLHKEGKIYSEKMQALRIDKEAIQEAYGLPESGTVAVTDLNGDEHREMFLVREVGRSNLRFEDVKFGQEEFKTWALVLNPVINQTKGSSIQKCVANALVLEWKRAHGNMDCKVPDWLTYLTERTKSMLHTMKSRGRTYAGPSLYHLLESQGLLSESDPETSPAVPAAVEVSPALQVRTNSSRSPISSPRRLSLSACRENARPEDEEMQSPRTTLSHHGEKSPFERDDQHGEEADATLAGSSHRVVTVEGNGARVHSSELSSFSGSDGNHSLSPPLSWQRVREFQDGNTQLQRAMEVLIKLDGQKGKSSQQVEMASEEHRAMTMEADADGANGVAPGADTEVDGTCNDANGTDNDTGAEADGAHDDVRNDERTSEGAIRGAINDLLDQAIGRMRTELVQLRAENLRLKQENTEIKHLRTERVRLREEIVRLKAESTQCQERLKAASTQSQEQILSRDRILASLKGDFVDYCNRVSEKFLPQQADEPALEVDAIRGMRFNDANHRAQLNTMELCENGRGPMAAAQSSPAKRKRLASLRDDRTSGEPEKL